jgi:glycosyltransferase involved in cell wall biosynthesis
MDSATGPAPEVSVIIPARNEARRIVRVIQEARRVSPLTEVIVVCNGVTDHTTKLALENGARVIEAAPSLGHDVGRAVGAFFARGDVMLFIDADFLVPAFKLRRYVDEVKKGWDVVLNAYSGYQSKGIINPTSLAKRLLNHIVGRPDLVGSSLTTVPHAMSRLAAERIGFEELAVPPKAQVKAVLQGLTITRVCPINTARLNDPRIGRKDRVVDLVLGDHAEAIAAYLREKGERAGFFDQERNRDLLLFPPQQHLRTVYRQETIRATGGSWRDVGKAKQKTLHKTGPKTRRPR